MLYENLSVNEKGHLEIAGLDAVELAKNFGTPLYVFDEGLIRENCRRFKNELSNLYESSGVIYAGKAFMTMNMAKIIKEEGLFLDVVSGGELYTAIKANFPANRIYFHGNNKSYQELKMAIQYGVGRIVVDNFYEIELINDICKKARKTVDILLRITPGIEAHTHDYIKTGQIDSKFGFGLENGHALMAVKTAIKMKTLNLVGLHCHIGSQIFDTEPFKDAGYIMMELLKVIKNEFNYEIEELDFGGGFGIRYTKNDNPLPIREYLKALTHSVKEKAEEYGLNLPKVLIEPGRAIVGPAGVTLYTVGAIKNIPGVRKYVSVDGGMSDNIRPALYNAKYEAVIANKASKQAEEVVSIAGKCCESGDMLIWDIELPRVEPGDILAVFSTGAYHYSMSSNYNMLPRPAVVFIKDKKARLIVKRETYEDLIRNEIFEDNTKTVSFFEQSI
ncbi:MAG: diaminopimelate decarboxylase [Thermovenabulum sp.]|uniref:diaminopimelate decarboxylase n=1 Tax=Thermovenabulum sp. TaxID=3100335 RepID=UPI003C7C5D5B